MYIYQFKIDESRKSHKKPFLHPTFDFFLTELTETALF